MNGSPRPCAQHTSATFRTASPSSTFALLRFIGPPRTARHFDCRPFLDANVVFDRYECDSVGCAAIGLGNGRCRDYCVVFPSSCAPQVRRTLELVRLRPAHVCRNASAPRTRPSSSDCVVSVALRAGLHDRSSFNTLLTARNHVQAQSRSDRELWVALENLQVELW